MIKFHSVITIFLIERSKRQEAIFDLNQRKSLRKEVSSLSSQGLSARRDADNKVCYVSKLDSSFPSPGELKQEIEQASEQSQPDEETTESSEWKVVGLVEDTAALPQKILDFCGTFQIYEIEIEENPLENSTLPEESDQSRSKRSSSYYGFCSYSDQLRRDYCLRRGLSYRQIYQWEYRTYCCYMYGTRCSYSGWFWRHRRSCRSVLVYNCNYVRYYVRCVSVNCGYYYYH